MKKQIKYTPVLKAKEGEFKALEVTEEIIKDVIKPIIEVTSIPWDYEKLCNKISINKHLANLSSKILKSFSEREFFLDSNQIIGDEIMENGLHYMEFVFEEFRNLNLCGIPVTSFNKDEIYKNSVREINNKDKRGIALRVDLKEFSGISFEIEIEEFKNYYNIIENNIDLIIDLKYIGQDVDSNTKIVLNILNNIPLIKEFRSVILIGTGFPENLSLILGNTIGIIKRTEWYVYNNVIDNYKDREIVFGDYCISHPTSIDMDPRFMQISASIRYTCEDYWIIVRGRSTKLFGFIQYHDLSEKLIELPEYRGRGFCWGDNYIFECSNKIVKCGNSTTWRKVGTNHHLELVSRQL